MLQRLKQSLQYCLHLNICLSDRDSNRCSPLSEYAKPSGAQIWKKATQISFFSLSHMHVSHTTHARTHTCAHTHIHETKCTSKVVAFLFVPQSGSVQVISLTVNYHDNYSPGEVWRWWTTHSYIVLCRQGKCEGINYTVLGWQWHLCVVGAGFVELEFCLSLVVLRLSKGGLSRERRSRPNPTRSREVCNGSQIAHLSAETINFECVDSAYWPQFS